MMKIIARVILVVLLLIGTLGVILGILGGFLEGFLDFMEWLFMLNSTQSEVSMAGEAFVKVATFVISYIVVGIVFNALGLFNSKIMKLAYFIVSTLVSFVLCYIVMLLEKYIVTIAIVIEL